MIPTQTAVHRALDSIQEAQRLADYASGVLRSVGALTPERKAIASLSDRLALIWFALCAADNRRRRAMPQDRQ